MCIAACVMKILWTARWFSKHSAIKCELECLLDFSETEKRNVSKKYTCVCVCIYICICESIINLMRAVIFCGQRKICGHSRKPYTFRNCSWNITTSSEHVEFTQANYTSGIWKRNYKSAAESRKFMGRVTMAKGWENAEWRNGCARARARSHKAARNIIIVN